LQKLKTILQSSYLYYYFLAIFLLILSLHFNFIFIILLIYLFIFIRRYHFGVMMVLFLVVICLFKYQQQKTIPTLINEKVIITNIEKPFDKNILTIKHQKNKYLLTTNESYSIGEYIIIKGKIKPFTELSSPNAFAKSKYYFKKGIYGEVYSYEIIETNKSNILYQLKGLVDYEYLTMFLGGEINEDLKSSVSNLNIYYLIAISGIHIYFLIRVLSKIMYYLDINKTHQEIIKFIFILILLLISGFTITLIRITIYETLKLLKKYFYNNITNYSLINLTYFIMIIMFPYLLFNDNLLISYLIVSILMIFRTKTDSPNILVNQIKTAFLVNLIILPFSNKFNIISILINPILIILIVYILFPIVILNSLLNLNILTTIIIKIESIIIEIGKNNFNLSLPSLNVYLIVIYFILLIITLITNNKKRIINIILMLIILISPLFKRYLYKPKLYFLDVGQGDSSVYISSESVVVIDSFKNVSSLLKYEGILTIDYLILSHSHLDHTNEANAILRDFKVKNVVLSIYENYSLNTNTNIIKAKAGLIIKDLDIRIEILSPIKDYNNSNNNSLVFIFSYDNVNVLYTGDIEHEVEWGLLYLYFEKEKKKIDILKVAHHGSKTSSLFDLIKEINPSLAIISVGADNKYNMPNDEVVNNFLKLGTSVYRTDLDGTILYYNNEIILL